MKLFDTICNIVGCCSIEIQIVYVSVYGVVGVRKTITIISTEGIINDDDDVDGDDDNDDGTTKLQGDLKQKVFSFKRRRSILNYNQVSLLLLLFNNLSL